MIDVSSFQGHVDWPEVHSDGVRLAAIKAGEGLYEKDPYFDYNRTAATKAGILVCPYFYGHPSYDPKGQARHFISIIGTEGMKRGKGRPGLDIEVDEGCTPSEIQKWCLEWCNVVDDLIRATSIVYTYSGFAPNLGTALVDHPLWIANYNEKRMVPPSEIGHWSMRQVCAHQYTDKGTVRGITGDVDRSYRFAHLYRFRIPRRFQPWS